MIWGMTLEPGQAQTEVIVGEIQLSMATMESRGCLGAKSDSFSHVVMRTSTAEYLLCTLVSGVTYQQNLDLKLMPNDKVTFSVQGTNVVYLTGYSYMPSEVMMDEAEAGVQADDWIEEANLDASVPRDDSGDFSGMDASYFPAMNQEDRHPHEREDEEKYSVEYSEDRDQYQPETDERVQTSDSSGNMMDRSLTSESKQTTQEPIDNAGVELVDVKEEIHTIADTTEDEPTQQIEREDRGQTINLPSTSTGLNDQSSIGSSPQPQDGNQNRLLDQLLEPMEGSSPPEVNQPLLLNEQSNSPTPEEEDIRQERGMPNLKCRYCSEVFLYPSRLKIHETKHTGERRYQCAICGRRFRLQSNKITHEKIHSDVRPFQCTFCGKRFRQQSVLKAHERIHTGERPYSCGICGKAFKQQGHVKEHTKKHNKPMIL
ncbi:uncharacterized protein [Apostichopus japonicus]|uniref:uncharacterized protein isoform X7 n=1 Tax=Stichopus japonicus TaxID=307972 RepID=UPI003AB344C7